MECNEKLFSFGCKLQRKVRENVMVIDNQDVGKDY